jgi:hypothetical protein
MANRTITDHDEIRRWAEERGGRPAQVATTAGAGEGETGIIRIDFPGFSGEGSLEEISWDEWFRKFDESGLALVVQDRTRGGAKSNFNKLVGRETAAARSRGVRASRRTPRAGAARGGRTTAARGRAGGARKAAGRGRAAGGRKAAPAKARKAAGRGAAPRRTAKRR